MVTRVIDGDTIDVRLNGIDTPERGQRWGKEATAALSRLVMGKRVELEPFQQDRYDRLIANVLLNGLIVNAELVKQGHAWAYRRYLRRENASLCTLEASARTLRRGLWALPAQERAAPWEWRTRKLTRFTD
jgi:endonuclease YncB( thermonuclease family)